MLDFLLRAGACPDTKDKDGKTPMMHVAEQGLEPSLISQLLQNGADPNVTDQNGLNYMDYARRSYNSGIIKIFTGRKKSVSLAPNSGVMDRKHIRRLSENLNLHCFILDGCADASIHKQLDPRSSESNLDLEKLDLRDIRDRLMTWERELNTTCEAKGIKGQVSADRVLADIDKEEERHAQCAKNTWRKMSLPACFGKAESSSPELEDEHVSQGDTVSSVAVSYLWKLPMSVSGKCDGPDGVQLGSGDMVRRRSYDIGEALSSEKRCKPLSNSNLSPCLSTRYQNRRGSSNRRVSLPVLKEMDKPQQANSRQKLCDMLAIKRPGLLPALDSGTFAPIPKIQISSEHNDK